MAITQNEARPELRKATQLGQLALEMHQKATDHLQSVKNRLTPAEKAVLKTLAHQLKGEVST